MDDSVSKPNGDVQNKDASCKVNKVEEDMPDKESVEVDKKKNKSTTSDV